MDLSEGFLIKIGVVSKDAIKGLTDTKKALKSTNLEAEATTAKTAALRVGFIGLGTAALAAASVIKLAFSGIKDASDRSKLSQTISATSTDLLKFQTASRLAGVESGTLSSIFRKTTQESEKFATGVNSIFTDSDPLGLLVNGFKLLAPGAETANQKLLRIADTLKTIKDTKGVDKAFAVGQQAGFNEEEIRLLLQGGKAISEAQKQAEALTFATQESDAKAREYTKDLEKLSTGLGSVTQVLAQELLPGITAVADEFGLTGDKALETGKDIAQFAKDSASNISKAFDVVVAGNDIIIAAFRSVKQVGGEAFDFVSEKVKALGEFVSDTGTGIKGFFSGIIGQENSSGASNVASEVGNELGASSSGAVARIERSIGQVGDGIAKSFNESVFSKNLKEVRAETNKRRFGNESGRAGSAQASDFVQQEIDKPSVLGGAGGVTVGAKVRSNRAGGIVDSDRATELRGAKFNEAFRAAEIRNNLPLGTLKALARQESRFRTDVKSGAGAKGITQFIDSTAKQFGVNVNDPISGINGAGKLIRRNLNLFGGDLGLALQAFNAGEGRIGDFLKGKGKPLTQETINYSKEILPNIQRDAASYRGGVGDTAITINTLNVTANDPQEMQKKIIAASPNSLRNTNVVNK